jgi:hypothetical protein
MEPQVKSNNKGKLTAGSIVESNLFGKYTIGIVYTSNSRDNKYRIFYITDDNDIVHIRTLRKEQMKDTGLIVDLLDDKLSSDLFNDSFYYNLISRLQNLKHDYIEVDGGSRKTKQRKTNRRRGKTNRRRRKH